MIFDVFVFFFVEFVLWCICFGIVLLLNFMLMVFFGFVDMLWLLVDDGDYSKLVCCVWSVIGEMFVLVCVSCGIQIMLWEMFDVVELFDYVVVVGGLLYLGLQVGFEMFDFVCCVVVDGVMVVGICIGVFMLMCVGVFDGYCICVSWFYYWDFIECFLFVDFDLLIVDWLFVIDWCWIMCLGGCVLIDVVVVILLCYFDYVIVQKVLCILFVGEMQKGNVLQLYLLGFELVMYLKVKCVIFLMEQYVGWVLLFEEFVCKFDLLMWQFEWLFKVEIGKSLQVFVKQVWLCIVVWLLMSLDCMVVDIVLSCGFVDVLYFGCEFCKQFGVLLVMYCECGGDVVEVVVMFDGLVDLVEDIVD